MGSQETDAASAFLEAIPDGRRREDCRVLAEMLHRLTGEPPRLWAGSIVGYGTCHHRYASGREGDSLRIGFSPRRQALTIYLVPGFEGLEPLLGRLGRHRLGRACLYIKRLSDVDPGVPEELLAAAWQEMEACCPR